MGDGSGLVASLVADVEADGVLANLLVDHGGDHLDLLGDVAVEEVASSGLGVLVGLVGTLVDSGVGANQVDVRGAGVLDDDGLLGGGSVALAIAAVDGGVVGGINLNSPLADLAGGDRSAGLGKANAGGHGLAIVLDGVLEGSGTIEVVGGHGLRAELPGGGSLNDLLVAVAEVDGGGLAIIEDKAKDDLLSVVARSVLGIVLEEVGATLGEVDLGHLHGEVLAGGAGLAVVALVNEVHTGSDRDLLIVVVMGLGDGEGAVHVVGLGASGALLSPVLAGLQALDGVVLANDGVLELVSLASSMVDLELDLRGRSGEREEREDGQDLEHRCS